MRTRLGFHHQTSEALASNLSPMVPSFACAITWSCMFDLPCAQRFTVYETCRTPVSPFSLHPLPPLPLPLERSQTSDIPLP